MAFVAAAAVAVAAVAAAVMTVAMGTPAAAQTVAAARASCEISIKKGWKQRSWQHSPLESRGSRSGDGGSSSGDGGSGNCVATAA